MCIFFLFVVHIFRILYLIQPNLTTVHLLIYLDNCQMGSFIAIYGLSLWGDSKCSSLIIIHKLLFSLRRVYIDAMLCYVQFLHIHRYIFISFLLQILHKYRHYKSIYFTTQQILHKKTKIEVLIHFVLYYFLFSYPFVIETNSLRFSKRTVKKKKNNTNVKYYMRTSNM